MRGNDDSAGDSMHTSEVPENDLAFECAKCGKIATRVRILEAGQVPEAQNPSFVELTRDARKIVVEVDGYGDWSSTVRADEIFQNWIAGDLSTIRSDDPMAAANWCFTCDEWYCADHNQSEKVVYGAPMYDYYFKVLCPRGHGRIVERT